MPATKAVGIDLGTTFSAIAWLDRSGRTAMLRNAEGDLLTPSVVLFGEGEVAVGKEARNAAVVNPDLVAEWVKRDMGAPYYSRPIHGQYLPPEVIQACILRKLNAEIRRALGPDAAVVITVPAYFDEPRRKATADAGEMAGLRVLDIVNEPTAAALAFGETLGYLAPGGSPAGEMTVLVYDLGGGTFDVTLLRLAPGDVKTLATDGDVLLGGHDWDMRLLDHAAESFARAHQLDPRQDPRSVNRLLQAVIEAKHTLSARGRATVHVEHAGLAADVPLTRETFAELTADLLERTSYTTRQLLIDAGVEWSGVDRVLLVGGSTRMPMVADLLRQLSGKEPERAVNPDEAVARGAALFAGYLLARQAPAGAGPQFRVTDVNSHSLGIEGIDPATMRKTNVVLIPRNTPLPATRTERFATKSDNQRSIVVQVLEGESSLPGECTAIGRTVIRELPPGMPQGWPIEVTFQYGANGRLNVQALVPGTHSSAALDLERAVGLNDAGIAWWKQPVQSALGFDSFETTLGEVLGLGGMAGVDAYPVHAAAPPAAPPPGALGAQALPAAPPVASPPGEAYAAAPPAPAQAAPPAAPSDQAAQPGSGVRPAPASSGPPIWLVGLIGYVTSAVVGLGLGYLVLSWLRPDLFPRPW